MIASLLVSLLVTASVQDGGPDKIVKAFTDPPRESRPYVWWHWMDGEVSPDGIRKDLEWMDAAGIAGFHQFDAGGVNMPKAAPFKRPYLSDSWKEAFRYAVRKADSLGLEMTVASAPGWSSTGGPWVSPEDAMKKLEWRTVEVKGGSVDIKLPDLQKVTGPYRDIPAAGAHVKVEDYGYDVAVIAVRLPSGELSMEEMGADLNRSGDTLITVDFPSKRTVRALTLKSAPGGFRPREGDIYGQAELQCSMDGKSWKTVTRIIKSPLDYVTVNIPPTKARHFRVRGKKLYELELFTVRKIQQVEEKSGHSFPYDFNKYPTGEAPRDICAPAGDVINLTGKMAPDGRLRCTLPQGKWRIYRFGASLTGKTNHPASPNATGLEVDKLNGEAWERYFHSYLDMYKEAAGGMLGERGITHLLIDSYEAGPETWTPSLPAEFASRRGYDLYPWLPVLTGQVLESVARSEAFLCDWRKTLAELFEENYGRVNEIIAGYGMKGSYIESHELGRAFVGDGMAVKKNATVPMSGIWMTESYSGSPLVTAIADIRESASVAHVYGKKIAAAESFTVNGDGKCAYTFHPGNIKMVADVALASGLNRFIIHDSASQPSDDYLPGLGLFKYGQWFHRNETWAPYARVWTDYLSRSCSLLQLGRNVADILLFYGEDTNVTAQYGGEYLKFLPKIPEGYNYDFANADVLLNVVRAEDGALVLPDGSRYRVLLLGACTRTYMSETVKQRIESLKAQGVPVCYEDELPGVLEAAGIVPDVTVSSGEGEGGLWGDGFIYGGRVPRNKRGHDSTLAGLQFVHREVSDGGSKVHLYWLRNFTGQPWKGTVTFRQGGGNAALFNAESVEAYRIPVTGQSVELSLGEGDAVFVAFTGKAFDLPDAPPVYRESEILALDRYWDVEFNQKGGEKAVETFSELNDWTTNSDPVVKYYSGTAVYTSVFTVPEGTLEPLKEARIDLGTVNVMAELIVNGHNAGLLWRAPFVSPDILPYLREGENTIEVKVTNLWVNRMIGDRQRGEKPVTMVRRFYNAGDKLLPSGLLGPVRLIGGTAE